MRDGNIYQNEQLFYIKKQRGGIDIEEEKYREEKLSGGSELIINGEFVKREIAGDIILVPVGETALKFNGMITLTETASVIWDALTRGASRAEIIDCILDEFEIDRETVESDVDGFLSKLKQNGFIKDTE